MYGKKISSLRRSKGYSQEYMAGKLNMTPGNYSKIETDNKNHLAVDTLEKIAELLEVSPMEIMGKEPMVVNFTDCQNGNFNGVLNADTVFQNQKELFEKLEKAKEGEIITLKETITNLQNLIQQQNKIIDKLAS